MRTFTHLLLLTATLLTATLAACESDDRCRWVDVTDGCKARCETQTKNPDGTSTVCSNQLQISRTGENSILQSENRKVTTKKLPPQTCFTLKEGAIVADEAKAKLVEACQ